MAYGKCTVNLQLSSPVLAESGEIELETLLRRAVNQDKVYAFQSIFSDANRRKYSLWVAPVADIDGASAQIHDAVAVCTQFITAPAPNAGVNCITFCSEDEDEIAVFHLVILRVPHNINVKPLNSYTMRQTTSFVISTMSRRLSKITSIFNHHRYHLLSSDYPSKSFYRNWRRLGVLTTLLLTILLFLIIAAKYSLSTTAPGIYLRYKTANSIGPKYQLRLTHLNATSWARTHLLASPATPSPVPYTLRLDDQTLIPSSLYTPAEEKYQAWYRNRYPHMVPIMQNQTYLRPSWLGSLEVGESLVWDAKFHFAHCILALRRYWWAKESGRHVCGRDIDYGHIEHCLGYLDNKVFTSGPMDEVWEDGNQYYLWWQTKVCFDE